MVAEIHFKIQVIKKETKMATAKVVNYSPETTAKLVAEFKSGVTVEVLAETFGKSVRSIIAKLSREKNADGSQVRTAKEYVSKAGEKVVKKDATADAIGAVLKMTDAEVESLTKANKSALVKIFAALANSVPA